MAVGWNLLRNRTFVPIGAVARFSGQNTGLFHTQEWKLLDAVSTPSLESIARCFTIQSLMATAKLNGLDPYTWLKETLEKLPAWPHRRIDELLPLRSA